MTVHPFLFRVSGEFGLIRFLRLATVALGCLSLQTTTAIAARACSADALGTSRTMVLDPARHSAFDGYEAGLGLRAKEVILTFDDGPNGKRTSNVLDILADECVKATFFAVGRMARSQGGLVRRIVRDGHTLGHHTQGHGRLPTLSLEEAGRRIDQGIATVERVAYGIAPDQPRVPFFRYPYLARTNATDRLLKERGLISFGTNIDSLDWKADAPGKIRDRIMGKLRNEGRGIILMHDIHDRTAKMLPMLLASLKREGYRVVHIVPPTRAPEKRPKPDDTLLVASISPKPAIPAEKIASPSVVSLGGRPVEHRDGRVVTTLPRLTSKRGEPVARLAEASDAGVTKKSTPAVVVAPVAKSREAVRKRRVKAREKAVQVASVRRTKRKAARSLKTAMWALRASQWIIN